MDERRPEAVLFDAGGTLVHLQPGPLEAALGRSLDPDRLLEAHYRATAELSADRRLAAGPASEWWPRWARRYLELAGVEAGDDEGASLLASVPWSLPVPGARRAVEDLREAGIRVAVISNSDGTARRNLAEAGLVELFEIVVDSHEVGIAKPDPRIFHLALERMGVAPGAAWYVGDSLYFDVEGARAAGLARAVLVGPEGSAPPGQERVSSVAELPLLLPGRP